MYLKFSTDWAKWVNQIEAESMIMSIDNDINKLSDKFKDQLPIDELFDFARLNNEPITVSEIMDFVIDMNLRG